MECDGRFGDTGELINWLNGAYDHRVWTKAKSITWSVRANDRASLIPFFKIF